MVRAIDCRVDDDDRYEEMMDYMSEVTLKSSEEELASRRGICWRRV